MMFLQNIWEKVSQSRAIDQAGPIEKSFFETFYRLVFITGLSTSDDYLRYTIFSGLTRSMCVLLVGLEIWHLFCDHLNLDELASTANVVFIHLITIWKLKIMYSNKDILRKLEQALDSPSLDISNQRRKDILQYWAIANKKYLKVLLMISYFTLITWYTFPLFDRIEYNLMIDIKLPFEYEGQPLRYCLTYIVVCTLFNHVSLMTVLSDIFAQAHLLPVICQLNMLGDCFENIFEECAEEFQASFPEVAKHELVKNDMFVDKYLKRLSDLVKKHREILEQTMQLKKILSFPMLGQLACSGYLICFIGYQAIGTVGDNSGKFIMSLLYLCYIMFTLYVLCRWCEEITLQSQDIGRAAYFSGWESGITQAPGVRAAILLVIARSNTPLVFYAGGMYPLTVSSYNSVVKASYSALNIILTTNHD